MTDYRFLLTFTLPDRDASPEQYLDALYEAGCDDATIGVGRAGMIGLDFTRAAGNAEDALRSAIANVRSAIPGAALAQAGPDLAGLTEMAEIFDFSRQNMRKYAVGGAANRPAFPAPAIVGEPSLWHLAEVVAWLRLNTSVQPPDALMDVAKAAAKVNFELEAERLRRIEELV
jgi:hypothetical protein